MLKKTITYTDYDGNPRTEDFYFNLTKTELVKMQLENGGAFADKIRAIIKAKDTAEIIKLFEEITLKAYGVKSPDGRRFMKNPVATQEFIETPAYDELYMELISDPEKFAAFINGLIPADLAEQVKHMQDSGQIPEELKELM